MSWTLFPLWPLALLYLGMQDSKTDHPKLRSEIIGLGLFFFCINLLIFYGWPVRLMIGDLVAKVFNR